MALPSDYISGTITLTAGSVAFSGVGTGWLAADFQNGDTILDIAGGGNRIAVIASITGEGAGTLTKPWEGPTLSGVAYRMRYEWDSSRVSAQSRAMIEQLGNGTLQSLAAAPGVAGDVVIFDGPNSISVEPRTNFINGVAYDVQVNTLADRAAYNGQSAGFTVLVSDVGDGRSAVYSKASNALGDWTNAAYITGPMSTVPGPVGVNWLGDYNAGTTYVLNDGVTFNGSSFRKLNASAAGTAPSNAIPPVSDANWEVIAARGVNGSITGVTTFWNDRITVDTTAAQARAGLGASNATPIVNNNWDTLPFDGVFTNTITSHSSFPMNTDGLTCIQFTNQTGGKIQIAFRANPAAPQTWRRSVGGAWVELVGANNSVTNAILADMATATLKGRVAAGSGDPQDLTAAQVLTLLDAYSKSNILGTVSQSAGVPTGAIIERGSNANGEYVRFADGTMICTHAPATTTGTTVWSFPSIFIVAPRIAGSIAANGSAANAGRVVNSSVTGTTSTTIRVWQSDGGTGSLSPDLIAIGRWF